jgi:hypothetical protein
MRKCRPKEDEEINGRKGEDREKYNKAKRILVKRSNKLKRKWEGKKR